MDRRRDQIVTFLNQIDFKHFAEVFYPKVPTPFLLERWHKNWPRIKGYWLAHPDMRFGQMLINMGIVPDDLTVWLREEQGIRDILKRSKGA